MRAKAIRCGTRSKCAEELANRPMDEVPMWVILEILAVRFPRNKRFVGVATDGCIELPSVFEIFDTFTKACNFSSNLLKGFVGLRRATDRPQLSVPSGNVGSTGLSARRAAQGGKPLA
jgi:hypothetical protein